MERTNQQRKYEIKPHIQDVRDGEPEFPNDVETVIGVIPDTQHYAQKRDGEQWDVFRSQMEYVTERDDVDHIIHLGDIVGGYRDAEQWEVADRAFDILDSGNTPYAALAGDHDNEDLGASPEDWTHYDGCVTPKRVLSDVDGESHQEGKARHYYQLRELAGEEVLLVYISNQYRETLDETMPLSWIRQTIEDYPDRTTILSTHHYQHGRTDLRNSTLSPMGIRLYPIVKEYNVDLVLDAHNGVGRSPGAITQCYQVLEPTGGNGFLRLLGFNSDMSEVYIRTYSPYTDETAVGEQTIGGITEDGSDPKTGKNHFLMRL